MQFSEANACYNMFKPILSFSLSKAGPLKFWVSQVKFIPLVFILKAGSYNGFHIPKIWGFRACMQHNFIQFDQT